MYNLKNIIDDTILAFSSASILRCAYLEKNLDDEFEDIHLYLIFKDKNFTFRNLVERINIVDTIKSKTSIYHIKLYDWDKVLHIVTEEKISIYFHIVNYVYNFENLNIIYNIDNIETKIEIDNTLLMVNAFEEFTNDLNSCFRMIKSNNNYIALSYLYKLYNDIIYFLGNYYLDYNCKKDLLHYDFNLVLNKLSKDKINKLKEIIQMMKLDNVKDCLKLIIWFYDEYAKNLPISVMQKIDIDYYIFLKEIILK